MNKKVSKKTRLMIDTRDNREEVLNSITDIFYTMLKNYAKTKSESLHWFIKTSISECMNQFPIINEIKVSQAAQAEYEKRISNSKEGVELRKAKDLKEIHFDDQKKDFKNGGLAGLATGINSKTKESHEKLFHWEHATTRSYLRNKLLEIKTDESEQFIKKKIKEVLEEYQICWITKKENDILNENYKSKRPEGWEKAYEDKGIVMNET